MTLLLDTATVDGEYRAGALHTLLTNATGPHEIRVHGQPEVMHARLEYWRLSDDVTVLHQESSGITHWRDKRHDHKDSPDRVVFVLHDGGPGRYVHEELTEPLRRGGLYVTDLGSHYCYSRPGDGVARILQLERGSLGMTFEQVQQATRQLYASPLYDLVRHHVADLCSAAPALTDATEASAVAGATVRLAGALLRTALASNSPRESLSREYLTDRIRLFIHLSFANPDLDPGMIAAAHNISVRYLYKLWSGHPQSLTETIMQTRLDAARRMIATDPGSPIATVGARCGFTNAAHFSRRFRAAFGAAPSQFRPHPEHD